MTPNVEQLIKQLQQQDGADRRYAAEDLGALGDPAGVKALAQALEDSVVGVREAAVDALIAIGGPETCKTAVRLLYADDTVLRNYAVEILQALGEAVIVEVAQLCTSPRSSVRKLALDILGTIPAVRHTDALEQVLQALHDANINVAAAAAEAIGRLGATQAVIPLTERLGLHAWLDATILLSLARIGGPAACQTLKRLDPARFTGEAHYAFEAALEMVGLYESGRGSHGTTD